MGEEIFGALRELVLALDVRVTFLFLENQEIALNAPLLYEKHQHRVWQELTELIESRVRKSWTVTSKNQKKMLIPLQGRDQLFGYCGINISPSSSVLQSVGGLSRFDRMSDEPVWGIAEYHPRAANRNPSVLAAPPEAMADWIDKQIALVRRANLTEAEIQTAIESLRVLGANLRPVFRILSERGPLGLDKFIETVKKTKLAIFPIKQHVGRMKETLYYSALPSIDTGPSTFYLKPDHIAFYDFTIYSDVIEHETKPGLHEATEYSLWGVIVSRLEELCLKYEVSINPARIIGKYIGLDSAIHDLSKGDEIEAPAIELKIE